MNMRKSLRMAMAEHDLKSGELAAKLGVSVTQVSNWLRTGRISMRYMRLMCVIFEMKMSEFIALGED